jgi:hypothetical protein
MMVMTMIQKVMLGQVINKLFKTVVIDSLFFCKKQRN